MTVSRNIANVTPHLLTVFVCLLLFYKYEAIVYTNITCMLLIMGKWNPGKIQPEHSSLHRKHLLYSWYRSIACNI